MEAFHSFLRDMEILDTFNRNFQKLNYCVERASKNSLPLLSRKRKRPNPLTDLDEQQFSAKYRFTKDNMRRIIELVRDDLEGEFSQVTHSKQVPVEFQIMAAIRYWGLSEHPEVTAAAHNVSNRTLAKICRRVAAALAAKASRYIRMPATLAEKERVTNAFQTLGGMPQVIGAVGHSNVNLRTNMYMTEKGNDIDQSGEEHVHIQVVCDASFKIRDVDCRLRPFEYENHSSEMFMQSRIKERFEQNEFRGRVLLGDDRLVCMPFLFTPVKFPATAEEYAFNRSHAVTLACVSNCLNLWRRRFGILGSEICASYGTARQTVIALALLHNMAIEWNDPSLGSNSDDHYNGGFFHHSLPVNKVISNSKHGDTLARLEFIKNNF